MSLFSSARKWSATHPAISCAGWSLGIVLFLAFFPFAAAAGVVGSALSAGLNWADDNAKLYFFTLLFLALFGFCFACSTEDAKHSSRSLTLGWLSLSVLVFSAVFLGGSPNESRVANLFLNDVERRLAYRLDPRVIASDCVHGNAYVSSGAVPGVGEGPRVFLCEAKAGGLAIGEYSLSNINIAELGCDYQKGCPSRLPWEARYDSGRNAVVFLRTGQTQKQCRLVIKKLDDRWVKHLSVNGKAGTDCSQPSNDILVAYPVEAIGRS
jgi:hypothetical protein